MPAADITVFERRDYIGGRLKHIRFGPNNIKIEVGGAAWTDDNIYMREVKLFLLWYSKTILADDTYCVINIVW